MVKNIQKGYNQDKINAQYVDMFKCFKQIIN